MSVRERLLEAAKDSRPLRFAARSEVVLRNRSAARARPREALRYLLRSQEISNFTYELRNLAELEACVSRVLEVEQRSVAASAAELRDDLVLRDRLEAALRANRRRDDEARYGYRYLYYCVARLAKPRTIVEVGTHDGLGAAILLRALERNAAEGAEGRLVSIDLSEQAGWLIPEHLRARLVAVHGEAAASLDAVIARQGCDFLIDDIGFAYAGKRSLFEAALAAGPRPLIVGSEFPPRAAGDPPTEPRRTRGGGRGALRRVQRGPRRPLLAGPHAGAGSVRVLIRKLP